MDNGVLRRHETDTTRVLEQMGVDGDVYEQKEDMALKDRRHWLSHRGTTVL